MHTLDENQAQAIARNFYFTLCQYLETWSSKLIEKDELKVPALEQEMSVHEFSAACSLILAGSISDNVIFDSYVHLNSIVREHCQEDDWKGKKVVERWELVLKTLVALKVDIGFFKKNSRIHLCSARH